MPMGNTKMDGRLDSNPLEDALGDGLHAALGGAHDIHLLAIAKSRQLAHARPAGA